MAEKDKKELVDGVVISVVAWFGLKAIAQSIIGWFGLKFFLHLQEKWLKRREDVKGDHGVPEEKSGA